MILIEGKSSYVYYYYCCCCSYITTTTTTTTTIYYWPTFLYSDLCGFEKLGRWDQAAVEDLGAWFRPSPFLPTCTAGEEKKTGVSVYISPILTGFSLSILSKLGANGAVGVKLNEDLPPMSSRN